MRYQLIVCFAPSALAAFTSFYFAGNNGNSSALSTCKGSPYNCAPPAVCASESLTGKTYCCTTGNPDAACWIGSPDCGASKDDHTPSSGQQACTGMNGATPVNYCCLQKEEECVPTSGYFNLCFSTAQNLIAGLNESKINETFSSLRAANPSASAYSIASTALLQLTSVTATSTTGSPSATTASTTTTATASTSSSLGPIHNGLSGGAIGGIVGGILGGLALIAIASFLYIRRRTSQMAAPNNHNAYTYQPAEQMPHGQPVYGQTAYGQPPTEKYAQYLPSEMPRNERPAEMDGRNDWR